MVYILSRETSRAVENVNNWLQDPLWSLNLNYSFTTSLSKDCVSEEGRHSQLLTVSVLRNLRTRTLTKPLDQAPAWAGISALPFHTLLLQFQLSFFAFPQGSRCSVQAHHSYCFPPHCWLHFRGGWVICLCRLRMCYRLSEERCNTESNFNVTIDFFFF